MNKLATQLNDTLGAAADFLSAAGKRMYFPYGGILGQGAEAKSCEINATIGMAFEEDGSPLVMDCFKKGLNLDKKAFLYAGSFGIPKLREQWKEMEFKKNPSLKGKAFSNPVVTNALTHGIRICAELFADKKDTLVCPDLFWDNYELVFQEAVGCKVEHFNTFKKGAFDVVAMKAALLAPGEKKILILNFPNNPTGYTATLEDAKKIVSTVKAAAAKGKKIVVICDDAYFGLVYEKGIHEESLFAEFSDLHKNVLAVKLDAGSAVLAGDDLVARLDFHLHFVAVHHSAGADDDDFVNFRLLLRRTREDNAALGLFLGLRPLEDNAIRQRFEIHGFCLLYNFNSCFVVLALNDSEC